MAKQANDGIIAPDQIKDATDEYDPEDQTEEVKNFADHPVTFHIDSTRVKLKPGATTRVNRVYAFPRKFQPNAPALPSVVEQLTGGKVRATRQVRKSA